MPRSPPLRKGRSLTRSQYRTARGFNALIRYLSISVVWLRDGGGGERARERTGERAGERGGRAQDEGTESQDESRGKWGERESRISEVPMRRRRREGEIQRGRSSDRDGAGLQAEMCAEERASERERETREACGVWRMS